jgi:hypothetical protein
LPLFVVTSLRDHDDRTVPVVEAKGTGRAEDQLGRDASSSPANDKEVCPFAALDQASSG